jgi:hypothetical protein
MAFSADEAASCKRQGDQSSHYTALGVNKRHTVLVKSALQMVLTPTLMCRDVAAALMAPGADGKPLLSEANINKYGGAWVCRNSAVSQQLCDGGESAYYSSSSSSFNSSNVSSTGTNSTSTGNSSSSGDNSTSDALDCTKCGSYMTEFAERAAAGHAAFAAPNVVAFCSEKVASEDSGHPDSSQEDVFATPSQCTIQWKKWHYCPTYVSSWGLTLCETVTLITSAQLALAAK